MGLFHRMVEGEIKLKRGRADREGYEEMISIDLCNTQTNKYFGLCLITPKSPMTHLILMELADLLRSRLYSLLTQQDQEGETTRKSFRRMAYPIIRQCVDEIAEMFGEDATVSVDLNLECYGQRSMSHLYKADLKIAFGVVREGQWKTVVLGEGWQEQMMEWLA